jgi:hypothetical protein
MHAKVQVNRVELHHIRGHSRLFRLMLCSYNAQ